MKYIIIGLGNYGHVLAEELSALGHEVIGADLDEGRVDSIKDKIATAFVIDATDEQSLSVLPLNSVDKPPEVWCSCWILVQRWKLSG